MTTDHPAFPTDTPASPEDRDALLTALALGELSGPERDEAERLLADPHAAADRAHVEDVRRIAAALRADRKAEPTERSADLRRAVLAALAAGQAAAVRDRDAHQDSVADRSGTGAAEIAPSDEAAAWQGFTRRGWLGIAAGFAGLAVALAVVVVTAPPVIAPARRAVPMERQVAQVEPLSRGAVPETAEAAAKQTAPIDALALGERDARRSNPQNEQLNERGLMRDRRLAGQDASPAAAPAAAPVADKPADLPAMQQAAPPANGPANRSVDRLAEAANGRPAPRREAAPAASRPESLRAQDERRAGAEPGPGAIAAPTGEARRGATERVDAAKATAAAPAPMAAAPITSAPGAPAPGPMNKAAPMAKMMEKETLAAAGPRPVDEFFVTERSAAGQPAVDADNFSGRGLSDLQRKGELRSDREGYAAIVENPFVSPAEAPLSTFSIDVDTASYANVRRFLSAGRLPPRDAVRIEELVNYFRYDLPQPAGDAPFSVTVEATGCPWAAGRRLVRVALQGRTVDRRARPAGNIVFLVDVSGSMRDADKLPLVQRALAMLVEELGEDDRVAIVTYAGDAGLVLPPTGGERKDRILAAIDSLAPGGSTHGSAGIELAYEQAAAGFIPGGVNRVILATDGDLNVGVTDDAALVELIRRKAAGGTFLTVLGVGTGNLQDAKMEKLADNGNGVYAYLDGLREARKVLVEQLTGSTITIAKDVKIQVEFNPARVASYRLIGYENRVMAAADFRDDRKDAGEIGAGHAVTALYEIVPAGAAAPAAGGPEPLKYQSRPEAAAAPAGPAAPVSGEMLTVKLRFKRPDGDTSTLLEAPLTDAGGGFAAAPADFRFAAAVAAFGMRLRGSSHAGTATLADVATIAGGALGPDAGGYRAEFLDLVRKAAAVGGTAPRD